MNNCNTARTPTDSLHRLPPIQESLFEEDMPSPMSIGVHLKQIHAGPAQAPGTRSGSLSGKASAGISGQPVTMTVHETAAKLKTALHNTDIQWRDLNTAATRHVSPQQIHAELSALWNQAVVQPLPPDRASRTAMREMLKKTCHVLQTLEDLMSSQHSLAEQLSQHAQGFQQTYLQHQAPARASDKHEAAHQLGLLIQEALMARLASSAKQDTVLSSAITKAQNVLRSFRRKQKLWDELSALLQSRRTAIVPARMLSTQAIAPSARHFQPGITTSG